ncbi:hypothetical protein MPH_13502, partial [Macrophomina phaseolina MS6]
KVRIASIRVRLWDNEASLPSTHSVPLANTERNLSVRLSVSHSTPLSRKLSHSGCLSMKSLISRSLRVVRLMR